MAGRGQLERVAQFAHIARPVVGRQARETGFGQGPHRLAALPGDLLQQRLTEDRQVLQPLAQGRQAQRQDIEAIVQVGPERAGRHHGRQIPAGGGDDPHVHGAQPGRTQGLDFPFLEHAQQLGLEHEGHVAHLVQKQAAAVGELELARPRLGARPGIGSRLDAEQLRLQQVLRNGRSVHPHQRLVGTPAGGVDGMGQQFLARARLAQEQHRRIPLRRPPGLLLDLAQLGRDADQLAEPVLGLARLGQLAAGAGQVRLHLLELGHDGLERLQPIVEDDAQRPGHGAGIVLQGDPGNHHLPGTDGEHVEQLGPAALDHLAQPAVRDDLLDRPPFDGLQAIPAQQRLVLVVDPGDAPVPVHHHGALVEAVEQAQHGARCQAANIGVTGESRSVGLGHGQSGAGTAQATILTVRAQGAKAVPVRGPCRSRFPPCPVPFPSPRPWAAYSPTPLPGGCRRSAP